MVLGAVSVRDDYCFFSHLHAAVCEIKFDSETQELLTTNKEAEEKYGVGEKL